MRRHILFLFAAIMTIAFGLTTAIAQDVTIDEGETVETVVVETDDNAVNSTVEQWEILGGSVLPLVVALLVQSRYNQKTQAAIMLVVVAVYTCAGLYLKGELDNWNDPAMSFITIAIATGTLYKTVWKPLGIAGAIEHRVNGGPASPVAPPQAVR